MIPEKQYSISISPLYPKFEPGRYFPEFFEDSGVWKDLAELEPFRELIKKKIPMGVSRYGGGIVDFPQGEKVPVRNGLMFAAQLNLNEFARADTDGLLPHAGFLYFFFDGQKKGLVLYYDVPENKLERHFLMPPEHPVFGSLQVFGEIKRSVEKWQDMYIKLLPEELECTVARGIGMYRLRGKGFQELQLRQRRDTAL